MYVSSILPREHMLVFKRRICTLLFMHSNVNMVKQMATTDETLCGRRGLLLGSTGYMQTTTEISGSVDSRCESLLRMRRAEPTTLTLEKLFEDAPLLSALPSYFPSQL